MMLALAITLVIVILEPSVLVGLAIYFAVYVALGFMLERPRRTP